MRLVANLTARRQLLLYVALPLAYIATGRLGLLLAADPGYATLVFLPAGIAVTATFFAGATALPGIFLGSFLLNLWIGYLIVGQLKLTEIALRWSSPPRDGLHLRSHHQHQRRSALTMTNLLVTIPERRP